MSRARLRLVPSYETPTSFFHNYRINASSFLAHSKACIISEVMQDFYANARLISSRAHLALISRSTCKLRARGNFVTPRVFPFRPTRPIGPIDDQSDQSTRDRAHAALPLSPARPRRRPSTTRRRCDAVIEPPWFERGRLGVSSIPVWFPQVPVAPVSLSLARTPTAMTRRHHTSPLRGRFPNVHGAFPRPRFLEAGTPTLFADRHSHGLHPSPASATETPALRATSKPSAASPSFHVTRRPRRILDTHEEGTSGRTRRSQGP